MTKINLSKTCFLSTQASVVFTYLKKAFSKTLILYHFNSERHIRIQIDIFSFGIDEIFSQLTLRHMTYINSDLSTSKIHHLYLVTFFSRKMISARTWYETYNGDLLTIIKAFNTLHHCLEGYKYEIFVLTDCNNFC